jgi:hypothetical protein
MKAAQQHGNRTADQRRRQADADERNQPTGPELFEIKAEAAVTDLREVTL